MDDTELAVIVLPCRHMTPRPTRNKTVVECGACPRAFELTLGEGGRVWDSREVEVHADGLH